MKRCNMNKVEYLEVRRLLGLGWFFDPPLPMLPSSRTITDIINKKFRMSQGKECYPRDVLDKEYIRFKQKEMVKNALVSLMPPWIGQLKRRFLKVPSSSKGRYVFGINDITHFHADAIPRHNAQNYLEMRQIRSVLNRITVGKFEHAADVGCGYGRLTPVLSEYAHIVHGFERENHLVNVGNSLYPNVTFIQVESLSRLGLKDGTLDLVMIVTVLVHINDKNTQAILEEIKRVVENGYVLLIEKTDTSDCWGNTDSETEFFSKGRKVETYQEWMKPFGLIHTEERAVIHTYFRKGAFSVMLFERE